MEYTFTADENREHERLNFFLKRYGVSTALIKKIKFSESGIKVNGVRQNANYRLHAGDIVTINTDDESEETTVISQKGDLDIVYEDRCVMVVNKPPYMPCHPSFNHPTDTLANFFVGLFAERGEKKIPRIINRLDRNTSGLVLIALDAHSAEKLKGKVDKTYTAIVSGRLKDRHGVIDAPIAREKESIITRCVRADGQRAVTEYTAVKTAADMTLVDVKLHTGRTHQIRAHFSHIGHPLLGDELYGGDVSLIPRHALHCGRLSFPTPDGGKTVALTREMPEDMKTLINNL